MSACYCGSADTRLYACGHRCPAHTPAALAGQPEPDAARYCAPARCHCGQCPRPVPQRAGEPSGWRGVSADKRSDETGRDHVARQCQANGEAR